MNVATAAQCSHKQAPLHRHTLNAQPHHCCTSSSCIYINSSNSSSKSNRDNWRSQKVSSKAIAAQAISPAEAIASATAEAIAAIASVTTEAIASMVKNQNPQQSAKAISNSSNIVKMHEKLIVRDIITSLGNTARVLFDCGSTTNFISKQFVYDHRLPIRPINRVQIVKLADGSSQSVKYAVTNLKLHIPEVRITEPLLVFPIPSYDIILGMPFFKKYCPSIDWKTGDLTVPRHIIKDFINATMQSNDSSDPVEESEILRVCEISSKISSEAISSATAEEIFAISSATAEEIASVKKISSSPSLSFPQLIPSSKPSLFPSLSPSVSKSKVVPYECGKISHRQIRAMQRNNDDLFMLVIRPAKKVDLLAKEIGMPTHRVNNIENEVLLDQTAMDKLRAEYIDVFPEKLPKGLPPKRSLDHKIPLEPNSKPPFKNYYRMSPKDLEEVKEQLTEMSEQGIIRPSHSPYSAPVLLAKKAGEVKRRFCVDYRDLNKITIKDRNPIPRVEDLLDQLSGAKYFTKLDLRSGYHQIRVAPEDIQKTAFTTKYGQFEFLVLPFGLTSAPATFVSMMIIYR